MDPGPAVVTVPADALILALRRDLAATTLALSEARAGLDTLHAALTLRTAEVHELRQALVECEAVRPPELASSPQEPPGPALRAAGAVPRLQPVTDPRSPA